MCHITNFSFHLTLNTAQTVGEVQDNNSLYLVTCHHTKVVLWEISSGSDIRVLKG